MDYKLAKQLKDAGFKQEGFGDSHCGCMDTPTKKVTAEDCRKEHVYFPTLSELIEACGDRFRTLLLGIEGYPNKEERWTCHGDEEADGWDEINDWRGSFNGKTPDIAVAKLYLKLNKK